jgi:hypothetical protein
MQIQQLNGESTLIRAGETGNYIVQARLLLTKLPSSVEDPWYSDVAYNLMRVTH